MTDANLADLVLRHDDAGVATLTLNRPEKRNALNVDMFVSLDRHLAALERETDLIGIVVLRAAGPIFSAGADLGHQQKAPSRNFQARTIERLASLPQAVLAAVHAPCFTGGLELVLAADIILVAEAARFADSHGDWSLVPGWGMTQRLPRRIGQARARDMMFTGRMIDGSTAEAWGLANRCVADDMFEDELARLTQTMLDRSWHSQRAIKAMLRAGEDLPLDAALAYESYVNPGPGPDFSERKGRRFD